MSVLGNIFWYPMATKDQIESRQQVIRDAEWDMVRENIPQGSLFLDVGCGAGDNMIKAMRDRGCQVKGIDPDPGAHGVGRFDSKIDDSVSQNIATGMAEDLPFEDDRFDVVFCSHVLEHVNSKSTSLQEMARVAKPDGLIVVAVPTHWMSGLGLLAQWMFTTHIRIRALFSSNDKRPWSNRLRSVFLPGSHSYPESKTVLYDLSHYRPSKWKAIIESELKVEEVRYGPLYAYPDFPQLIPVSSPKWAGSSVFFFCHPQ